MLELALLAVLIAVVVAVRDGVRAARPAPPPARWRVTVIEEKITRSI